MEKEINEKQIRIKGKFPIPTETNIELGKDYVFVMKVGCQKTEKEDNHDGKVNMCYVFLPEILEITEYEERDQDPLTND